MARAVGMALFFVALAACTSPRTQIMVTTDTDLAIPAEIDEIAIEVTGPDGDMGTANANLDALPAFVAVYHEGGALEPVTVRVVGRLAGADVIERRAVTAFQSERTVVLPMNLLASCRGASCADGETCAEGGCRSEMVAAAELADWTGMPPSVGDAGVVPDPDSGLDLSRDPLNCGRVGNGCAAAEVCISGMCTCRPEFTDDGAGGCVNLQTDPMNCGRVGNVCDDVCRRGDCTASCGSDDQCGNACTEIAGDVLNCGACEAICAANQVCADRACRTYAIGVGCTSCPCDACAPTDSCCEYPGFGDIVCVDGPCP